MEYILNDDLINSLTKTYRVYLCGALSSPQPALPCIHDDKIEIGISHYREFTSDIPHFHENSTEYNFILQGTSKVFLLDEVKEYIFQSGSIFVLPPKNKYAFKHSIDTKILFIKSPGGNDKKPFAVDAQLESWLKSW